MAEHFNGAAAWAERKKERAASFDGAAAWSARREQRRAALAAAPQPLTTRETERADELDKLTRPSARRTERADEADKQTPARRTLETPAGSALVRNTDSGALQQRMVQQLEAAAKNGLFQRTLPEERGSRHRSGKELSQKILHDTETAERIRNAAAGTAQGAAANAAGFLGALVAAAEKIDKQYRDEKERLGAATHADEMNPYPRTNEEVTRGNRAGVQLLEGIADTQRAKAQANTARAKEGASALGSIGIDALQIGLNLAAIVGTNAIAPGAGLALMGTQSGGAAANDYRQYAAAKGQDANPFAAAGLALGGLASAGIGSAAAKGALKYGGALVNRLGLGNSAIAQYALGALGDMAFSGGMSAANEYAKAAAYGDSYKEVRISGEDLAKDMLFQAAVGFLCRTLASPFGGNTSSAGQPERVQREYFKGIDNLDDLAKAFKQYGRKFHPDRFATADAATQRQMSDIFARISAEYNAVKAELAIETAGRAAKSYGEKRGAKTPEAAEQAGRAVENELMILKRAVENGTLAGAEAAEAVQIMEAAQGSASDSPAAGAEDGTTPLRNVPESGTLNKGTFSLKEELKNGRAREESRDDFLQRAAGEGYGVVEGDSVAYGYRSDRPVLGDETGARQIQGLEPAEGGAGDDLSDRGGRRDAGARAGEPAGGVESSRPQRAAEQSGAAIERQNLARDLRLQKVSSAELGVRTGTDAQSVTVLPEERWDAELRDAAERIQRETGKKTTMVLGAIPVRTKGGVQRVRGVWASEGIIIQADNLNVSASQIASHEIFHEYADQNPGLIQAVERSIREKYGSEEFDRVLDAYIRKLRGIIDIPKNAADYEAEQALLDIKNEIFADAYADINAFGQRAGKYRAEVRQTLEGRGIIDTGSEAEAATARRTGPPERYSIRRTQDIPYQEQIDAFYGGDLKTVGRSDDIYVADADSSLDALGLGGKPFFMLKRNLQKITRKEGTNKNYSAHGIGEDIIRDLPDMLKDPAIVIVGDGRISVIPGRTVDTAREKAAPLLIGINPNGSVDGASAYEIKTMYGREDFADWLGLRAGDSKIIAGNENKAAALLRNVGIKITEPVAYAADLTNVILSQGKSDVKFPTLGEEIRRQIQGDETEKQRYSIEEAADGKKYVRADRQVIFGNDPQSWSEQLEDYINGKIRRGQDVKLIGADGDELILTATSAGKLSDNHTSDGRTMSETAFERKANAASHIDELAQVSVKGDKTVADHNSRHGNMASSGWNYRTAFFKDFDGKYYKVTISTAQNADGRMIYNIGQMQERSIPRIDGSSAANSGALRGDASADSLSRGVQNVKLPTLGEEIRRQIMGNTGSIAEKGAVRELPRGVAASGSLADATGTASDGSIADKRGNVKYSLDEQRAEDETYLSLAKDPKRNRGKLQEMVNAAAERAGYDSPDLYHGTRAFGFTEFDLAKMDDGTSIFLTTNPTVAGTYTSVDAENTNLETLYRNPKSPADRGNPLKRVDAKSAPLSEVIAAWNREADALGAHKYRASSHEEVLARAEQKIGDEAPRMAAAAKRYAEETDGLSLPVRQYLRRLSDLGNYSGKRLYEEIFILKETESGFEQGTRPDREMNAFVERTGGIPTETAALARAALSDGAFVEYVPNGKNVRSGHPARATEAKFREFYQRQAERENGIYKVRARLQNPLVIDAQGAAWSDVGVYAKELALEKNANLKQLAAQLGLTVEDSGSFLSKKRSLRGPTRSWSQYAKSREYDGVIFKNLYDPGTDVENDANGVSDVYIVFDPAQVKSTEAVTYDDSGRAIPLSERFDAGERDIRYSADDEGDGEWDEIPTLGEEIRRQIMGEEAKGGSIAKKRGNIKPRTFWEEVRHQIQGEEPDKQRYSAENDEFYERLDEELADRAAEEDRKAAREKGIAAYSKPLIAKKELQKAVLDIFSVPVEDRDALRTTIDQYADSVIKRGKLTNRERSEFFNKMYGSGIVRMEADKVSKAAGQYVAHRKIYVPSEAKAQFGDSWNSFRKRAYAAGIYLTNDQSAIGVEAINAELSEQLPTLFDPSETSERQTLERIVQLAEEGQAERVSLSEYIAQVAGKNAGYADRILNGLEQKMDQALQTFAEKAGLETELRSRSLRRELAEHDRRIEMAQKKRENRELREMQQKTLKQLQWLSKNRSRAPEAKRAAWDEVLGDIDIYAASAANEMHWSKKHEATWGDLRDMYLEAKNGAEHGDPKYANFMPSKELQHIVDRLDKDKLADMDIDALKDLYKAAVGLRTEFYNRNKVLNDEHDRVFEEIYTDAGQEIRNAPKGKKRGGAAGELFDELINGQQLSPMNIIQRMGGWNPDGALYSMAKQLETGERNVRDYTVKANRLLEDFLNQHQDWAKKADGQGEDAIWYELEVPELIELGKGDKPIFGDTVKVYMTPAQKVHLYLESKNYDNLLHMTGGRTFVNRELYSKGKRSEALEQGTTVKLAPESVKKLVSSLTPEEAELARILERYYNDFAPKAINRVSNVLLGYDKAVTKNYAPIYTNRNYTKSEFGVFDMSAEGVGNLKERKRSTTPSYNLSAFDAFEKHVEQTARYTGMAIPTRNMNTLLDWRGKDDSMRDVIAHEWGGRANKYIEDLVTEMQGEKNEKSTVAEIIPERVFSNYISAVFGFNPSIVLKQLGSIPMGSAYLGAKNFPSPKKIRSIDKKLISKYTQELAWRTMGYSMPETKQLKDNPNWTETNKTVNTIFGGGAITAMDGWAASILWPQAENKVRREHPELEIGTKEQIDSGESPFYQEVAREFNDAVARSQSTSDIIHQSTLRRSRNPIARAFTLFKSDSAQTYNAIRQKYGEWQYYKRSGAGEETLKKARRGLGEAVLAALVNAVWSGTVTFLVAAVKNGAKRYRDDDDELTAESVFKEFGMGLVGDLAGIMAGGEELADIIGNGITGERWYRIEAPGLEQMDDLLEGAIERVSSFFEHAGELNNIIENKGDVGEYLRREGRDIAGWIREVAKDAATYLPGVPANNIEAYLLGAVRSLSPELAAAYEDAFMRVEKSDLSHLHGRTLTAKVRDLLKDRTGRDSKEAAGIVAGLYDDGYTDAVPTATPSKVTIDKKDRELNAYQTQVYEKTWRKAVGGELDRLVTLNAFRSADGETQEKMLRRLYTYAGEMAKAAVFDDYEPKKFAGEYADAAKKGRSVAALITDELG